MTAAKLVAVPHRPRDPRTLSTRKAARAKLDLLLDIIREWDADHVGIGGSGKLVLGLQARMKVAAREWAQADREARGS